VAALFGAGINDDKNIRLLQLCFDLPLEC